MKRAPEPAWQPWLCRGDLKACEATDRDRGTKWPLWAERIAEGHRGGSLVAWCERTVRFCLIRSGAMNPYKPGTRLLQLGSFLGATVIVERAPPQSSMRAKPAGRLIREGDRTWRVIVSDTVESWQRFVIAHELAHAMLFRGRRGTIDDQVWRKSACTPMEECICNYMARMILMPRAALLDVSRGGADPPQIIASIAPDAFVVSPLHAAWRWLDLVVPRPESPPAAVIGWQPYDPFDASFASACLRDRPDLREPFERAIQSLRPACRTLPRAEKHRIWSDVLDRYQGSDDPAVHPFLLKPKYARADVSQAIDALRIALAIRGSSASSSTMHCLADRGSNRILRPEWAAVGGVRNAFIPLRRGTARAGSAPATLFESAKDGDCIRTTETVDIGRLRGHFLVCCRKGFSSSTRNVELLATYESCPSNRHPSPIQPVDTNVPASVCR